MNTERNCQSCKYYKDEYCENLELKPCYPQKGCDYFSKRGREMKVYCAFKFRPFEPSELVGIAKTEKKALEILKREFPHMRGSIEKRDLSSDKNGTYLLAVEAMDVEE